MLAWCRAITVNHHFDQQRDALRFQVAFDALLARCRRWPAPVDLLDAMPRIVEERKPFRLMSDVSRKRGLHAIRDLADALHVDLKPSHERRRDERQ